MSSWYDEVDPAIRGHGEPHVIRVSVVSTLIPRVQAILLISGRTYLSEYFEIVVRALVARSTEYSSMNQAVEEYGEGHCSCLGLLKVQCSN